MEARSSKSYGVAVSLSAVFGVLGIQHFYLERWLEAIIDFGLAMTTIALLLMGHPLWALLVAAIDAIHTHLSLL